LILIGALVYPSFAPVGDIATPAPRSHPNENFNTIGDPNAPVFIQVFSDFQCSHCRNFYNDNEEIIIQNYVETGLVYMEYHSFGDFDGTQPDSSRSAQAAYCAGDQGKFFEMHDYIFENYGTGYSERRLEAMAELIGMDVNQFSECLSSEKYLDMVRADGDLADQVGVRGTPSFLVNGFMVEGNDMLTLQAEIERALLEAAGQ
jgi:protein-disulfide isomerase